MPELPEVDHARAVLDDWLVGRAVRAVVAEDGRPVRAPAPELRRRLSGCTARSVGRWGKHLLVRLDGVSLHLHLGMSGRIVVTPRASPAPRHARLSLETRDGPVVHLVDARRFGTVELVDDVSVEDLARRRGLGPDLLRTPLDADALAARLALAPRRRLHAALLDQRLVAGLGNVHATDALWRARLDPARPVASLGPQELDATSRAIREQVEEWTRRLADDAARRSGALRHGDAEAFSRALYVSEGRDERFLAYGRADEPCRRCGGTLRAARLAGRTVASCPGCQGPRGVPS